MMRSCNFPSAATRRKIKAYPNINNHYSWSLVAVIIAILTIIPKTTFAFQLSTISPTTSFRHDRCVMLHVSSDRCIAMTNHQNGIHTRSIRIGRCRSSSISISTRLHSSTNASIGKSGGRVIDNLLSFETQVLLKNNSNENSKNTDYSDEDNTNTINNNNDNNIVMVFYTAPWCGPCRLSNPVVKEINQLFKITDQLDVVEICTDDLPEVPEMAGVVSIPTIQLYHKGQLQETIVGCVAKNVLEKAIRKLIDEISPDPTDTKKES